MFLKVLSLIWLLFGAPLAQNFPHDWMSRAEVTRLVKAAILEANAKRGVAGQLEAKILARDIVSVSRCFEIDPMIFTALIWRESHFRHTSISGTGAVGLTQLTQTGIHEVLDRLSPQSIRKRDSLRTMLSSCAPEVLNSIPEAPESFDLYEWKRKVAESPRVALLFGAILLKINLNDDYRTALEKYNGDKRVKVRFAKDVLTLANWISASFIVLPAVDSGKSKFLASIQSP